MLISVADRRRRRRRKEKGEGMGRERMRKFLASIPRRGKSSIVCKGLYPVAVGRELSSLGGFGVCQQATGIHPGYTPSWCGGEEVAYSSVHCSPLFWNFSFARNSITKGEGLLLPHFPSRTRKEAAVKKRYSEDGAAPRTTPILFLGQIYRIL